MTHALFDLLSERYRDGTPLASREGAARATSVRDHLARLLNARRGVLWHLPDYGLPDVPALYRDLPYSADTLADEVRRAVGRFEPRLEEVSVRRVPAPPERGVIVFTIAGRLPDGERVGYDAIFGPDGEVSVEHAGEGGRGDARLF